jgi:ribosomal peptide maturation radical SAM protein 1
MTEIMRERAQPVDVLLVSMPFGILVTPSLALGLLQASIENLRVQSRQRYYSMLLAERLGFTSYQLIANRYGSGHEEMGEWAFAETLFPDVDLAADEYVERFLRHPSVALGQFFGGVPDEIIDSALKARSHARQFIDDCMTDVAAMNPRVVAITSMFQQRVASLALARRIKAWRPDTVIIMGGADCEAERGKAIVRNFRFVNAAVSGHGDLVFPELVTRALEGRPLSGIPGVYTSADARLPGAVNTASPDLDSLPYPMFEDYFRDLETVRVDLPLLYLSLETSRGCWWGEKHHCTFCSINGAGMTYLSKSAPRVVEEVKHFSAKYPGVRIIMTDSILNVRHLQTAIPELARSGLDLDLMYEVRASITEEQMKLLLSCGVRTLQPGIETLSTAILKLMRKHTSYLTNLRFLKLARLFDIEVLWNMLIGFPDEPPEAYAEMGRLVPKVTHLEAPKRIRMIEIGRHSPLFEDAGSLGVANLQASPAYKHIYPFPEREVRALATYFTYEYENPRDVATYVYPMAVEVQGWQRVEADSTLTVEYQEDRSIIEEGRPAYPRGLIVLEGVEHEVHRACEDIMPIETLVGALARVACGAEIEQAIASLERRGLLVRDANRVMSLAVPRRAGSLRRRRVYGAFSDATAIGVT